VTGSVSAADIRHAILEDKVSGTYPQERFVCPGCGGDCLTVEWRKGVFHCHKCEESGKLGALATFFDLASFGGASESVDDSEPDVSDGVPPSVDLSVREHHRLIKELVHERCLTTQWLRQTT
jgi:ribosomal protein L37AE/L43A